ncbi:sugar ABC transporter permease [uncultured Jatrophihabitans sp.]|uniref:sugar ABC transporter permease n=1 Tax=uncultured Jatrophihabitans sp. TaxID=1610747 RepID=UPI0035CA5528
MTSPTDGDAEGTPSSATSSGSASTPTSATTTQGGPGQGGTLDGPQLSAGKTGRGERASSFSLDIERRGIGDGLRGYVTKVRTGEPGALPSILGLVVLGLIFSQVSDRFFSEGNIGALPGQGAYIAVIALGLVFVLLLGEIDLSAGTTGGICAAFAAQAIVSDGLRGGVPGSNLLYGILIGLMVLGLALGIWLKTWIGSAVIVVGLVISFAGLDQHVIPALIFAISVGSAVGTLTGFLVAKVGIPSFIVTLALFLAWQGVVLFALNGNPINVTNYAFWHGLAYNNMSVFWSWVFSIVVAGGYLLYTLFKSARAQARGLAADTYGLVLLRGGIILVVALVLTALANQNRNPNPNFVIQGIPWAASIPISLMIVCTIVLTKTTWGRHLFATGGNTEAARRAGIDVVHIRVSAFVASSSFAALGGIFLASYQSSVSLDLGAGNILLFSVAAAVIGGTSLFGGRGKARDAIIGALVIVIIPNGILLRPSLPAQYQNVITGLVLLVAAAVDALSRRRSRAR